MTGQLTLPFTEPVAAIDMRPPPGWIPRMWRGGRNGAWVDGPEAEGSTMWMRQAANGIEAEIWWANGGWWVSRWSDNPGFAINRDGEASVIRHRKGALPEALTRLDALAATVGGWA